ncbi:hypothetical protein YC2023_113903 [Brassica napus]
MEHLHPPESRPTTAELNVASTSWGPEPAPTELTEPPPPGDKTKKPQKALHRAFLATTAPLHQNQNRHGRPYSRAQARRRREGTTTKRRSKTFKGAPVTARTLTRRPITGPEDGSTFLLSLFP